MGYTSKVPAQKEEYNTKVLLREYGPYMPDVVYQAFQINCGYILLKEKGLVKNNSSAWEPCTRNPPEGQSGVPDSAPNCLFGVIGRDETDIPIIVTRIGKEEAKNKLVIAGPHGNERIARFVVLETQRYFIEKGISDPDLVLYFIPAMSPTMFFADARGLPFVEKKANGEYEYKKDPNKETSKIVMDICKILSIPKLHDIMAKKVGDYIMHENIQSYNVSPVTPKYGIDANRDYYSLLRSTVVFNNFINDFIGNSSTKEKNIKNTTVIMLHGHENANTPTKRINNPHGSDQGTVLGPYDVIKKTDIETKEEIEIGVIDKKTIMIYIDFMTYSLFGYKFNLRDDFPEDDLYNRHQTNYFFGGGENTKKKGEKVAVVTSFKGEWARKLYKGDKDAREIPCFDIELSNNYRDGTRGAGYDSNKVLKRGRWPFFKKNERGILNGKFAEVNLKADSYLKLKGRSDIKSTIPFYELLEIYFDYRSKYDFPKDENK